jgi:hypothetical protein
MSDFYAILKEWNKFLNSELLNEVKVSDFFSNENVINKIGHEVFEKKVYNSKKNKWIKPFNDNDYAQILYNTLESDEEVDIQKVIDNFDIVKEKILTPFNSSNRPITAEGGRKSITISSLKDLTFSKCNEYIEIKKIGSLRTASYIKCLSQNYNNKDFELVGKTSKYLIFYPKTVIGSISLARSYYDLRAKKLVYDTSFNEGEKFGEKIGSMEWCTSISGSINYFNNYHVNQNIHMYYFIQINYNMYDSQRKLCVGLSKKNGEISLANSRDVFVDANNDALEIESLEHYIGEEGKRIIFSDAKKDSRKEFTKEQYYVEKTLKDYIDLRNQNNQNPEDISEEVALIIKFSNEKKEIANYICENDNNTTLIKIAYESGLIDSTNHEKILEHLGHNEFILRNILRTTDNNNIISKIINTGSEKEKKYISANKNVPIDILQELSKEDVFLINLSENESINMEIFKKIIFSKQINYGIGIKRNLLLNKSVPLSFKVSFAKTATEDDVLDILISANNTDKEIEEKVLIIFLERYKSKKDIVKFVLSNSGLSADNFVKYGENIIGASAIVYRKDIHADLVADDMTRSIYILANIAEYTDDTKVIDYILESKKEVMVLISILHNRICQESHRVKIAELCIKRKSRYDVVKSSEHLEILRIILAVSRDPNTIDRISKVRGLTDTEYRTIISNNAARVETLKYVYTVCSKNLKHDAQIAIARNR